MFCKPFARGVDLKPRNVVRKTMVHEGLLTNQAALSLIRPVNAQPWLGTIAPVSHVGCIRPAQSVPQMSDVDGTPEEARA